MTRYSITRNGALGDILCILNLRDQIRAKYGPFDLYSHPSCYRILSQFITDNNLCDGFFTTESVPNNSVSLTCYPMHEGYPNSKPNKHLYKYIQDELHLTPTPLESLPLLTLKRPECFGPKNITIQGKTGWSIYKEYPHNQELIRRLAALDFKIIQIGGPDDPPLPGIDAHLLGRKFEEQVAAQCWADLHIGPDSVFNHTSNYEWSHKNKRTPSIIYFGSTSSSLSGYDFNCNVSLGLECQPCFRENPGVSTQKTDPCPFQHKCLKDLTVDQIVGKVEELI